MLTFPNDDILSQLYSRMTYSLSSSSIPVHTTVVNYLNSLRNGSIVLVMCQYWGCNINVNRPEVPNTLRDLFGAKIRPRPNEPYVLLARKGFSNPFIEARSHPYGCAEGQTDASSFVFSTIRYTYAWDTNTTQDSQE